MSRRPSVLAGRLPAIALALLVAGSSLRGEPAITYRLSMPEPWTHLFHVTMDLDSLPAEQAETDVVLPAWRSGRYVIFDFAGGVVAFAASGEGRSSLPWFKIDKNTWRIRKGESRSIRVEYTVYADEFAQRTRGLNSDHGFVDGTAVFLYVQELRRLPVDLIVEPYTGWHVTTSLETAGNDVNRFHAPSYDVLVDSPLEIGTQRDYGFIVDGRTHILSIAGTFHCDVDSLISDISAIVRVNARFWGDLPYKRYVFLLQAFPGGGGGTEHLNSCILSVPPDPSPRPRVRKDLRSLVSHEFFHVWNVKRLRPRGMDPYDWTRENYYRELWLAEGGTSYMHGRLMRRAGLSAPMTPASLAAWIQNEEGRPGNRSQSIAESSFDAWIKYSRHTEQAFNFESDFYERGALVCGLMDLEIRHRSSNAHSFDDLLRALYARFPLGGGGYTVEDVEATASELAGSSMKTFFRDYVLGTRPVEWNRFLGYAGLRADTVASPAGVWWGAATVEEEGRTRVRSVVRGSSAYVSGVELGDEIVALDGSRVDSGTLAERIAGHAPGDTLRLTLFRNELQRTLMVPLAPGPHPSVAVIALDRPTALQQEIRQGWLDTAAR